MSSSDGPNDTPLRPAPKATIPPKPKGGDPAGGSGGGGGPPAGSPCDIDEMATINSPDRTVVSTLRLQDVLDIELDPGPPLLLLAKTRAGSVVGSITSPSLPQIVVCIRQGYAYDGTVLAVTGGRVEIQIRPR